MKQLDGITFVARIMVEPASDPKYRDQNRLANVILSDEPQYTPVMKGEAVDPEPVNAKPRKAAVGSTGHNAPAWATDDGPAQTPQVVTSVPWGQPQANASSQAAVQSPTPQPAASGPAWLNG